MIRFLLVLLAFVSALLAFIFQETALFVASGGLLVVSVVLLLLQVREQSKRKNRLKLPNDLTPEDELRARGVLGVRPKAKPSATSVAYAPPELSSASSSEDELRQHGILEVREKHVASQDSVAADERPGTKDLFAHQTTNPEPTPEISGSVVSDEEAFTPPSLFAETAEPEDVEEAEELEDVEEVAEAEELEELEEVEEVDGEMDASIDPAPVDFEVEDPFAHQPVEERDEGPTYDLEEADGAETVEEDEEVVEASSSVERRGPTRRRVEVDAHLPALQTSIGAHTICLIDVDTEKRVYRLRSIVSAGYVDNAGTEYPFAGFFLSDLLAETTIIDIGPTGLALAELRYHKNPVQLDQVIASPVMRDGLPAAFLVAGFEGTVDESSRLAVTGAAAFFSSLYALEEDHPPRGDSPLARAKRKPPSLRLVKSNPKSSQSKIIAEEMTKARGESYPLALALVCLDRGDEISRFDETTVYRVEEWMRQCLEQITPDGRIEYLGELGYGIIQLTDVSDVEGWVRRAQQIFRSQHGPVDAHPIVGVAMLSDGHRDPEDLQADAVRALRAAYETGDSTILVG